MDAEQGHVSGAPEPASAPDSAPLPRTVERPHRWGLGAFLLVGLVYLLVAKIYMMFVGDGPLPASTLAVAVAVPTMSAAGVAVLITKLRGNGPRVDLRLQWSARSFLLGLAFGMGGLFITIPAAIVYVLILGDDANSAVGEMFGGVRSTWTWAVIVFVIVAFIGPLCEEIVYRGLLWGAIDWRWGRWAALAITTVVFALAHLEPTRIPLLLIAAIPIGLARMYTGGLLASIVAHQVANLIPASLIMLAMAGVMPAV